MSIGFQSKLASSILCLALTSAWSFGSQIASGSEVQSPNPGSTSIDNRSLPSVPVPHSAPDILKLALDMNGLEVPSAQPWHIKLSYDQFDDDGDNDHSGTIEEFYVEPKKFKRIYTSDTFNRIDIANEAGLFRVGDQSWPSVVESGVLNTVLHPLDLARWDNRTRRPEKTELKFGNDKLPCVNLHDTDPRVIHFGAPVFCFEPGTVMLRYVNANMAEVITYDSIVLFQGHYVAREITIRHVDKPFLKIHVEEIGSITKISDSFFALPPDAKGPLGGRIPVPSSTYTEEYQISSPQPAYPRGVSGLVHVKYVVGKDGSVIEATANDGPEQLRKAVLEAVRKYRFRPYLLLDQPVEVESTIEFTVNSR
jgi:TonB family protein